jgi:hypothetical protein
MTQEFVDAASCWKALLSDVTRKNELLPIIEKFAKENFMPADIAFGTSGWRGEIGTDLTFNNVRIVTAAITHKKNSRGAAWFVPRVFGFTSQSLAVRKRRFGDRPPEQIWI